MNQRLEVVAIPVISSLISTIAMAQGPSVLVQNDWCHSVECLDAKKSNGVIFPRLDSWRASGRR